MRIPADEFERKVLDAWGERGAIALGFYDQLTIRPPHEPVFVIAPCPAIDVYDGDTNDVHSRTVCSVNFRDAHIHIILYRPSDHPDYPDSVMRQADLHVEYADPNAFEQVQALIASACTPQG